MGKLFTITGTSPAAAGTAALTQIAAGPVFANATQLHIVAELVGATGGTLNVYLQWSPDDGTTWYDYTAFTQLAAGAAAVKYRVTSDVAQNTISTVGKGTSPALSAGTHVGGPWGTQMRVLCVAGASTSAGAAITVNIWAK